MWYLIPIVLVMQLEAKLVYVVLYGSGIIALSRCFFTEEQSQKDGGDQVKKIVIFSGLSIFLFLIFFIAWTGSISLPSSTNNPNARDILKGNPNADILKLDGLIYTNVTKRKWTEMESYAKGGKIGEIKNTTTNAWLFLNLYATNLPKGAKVFMTNGEKYERGEAPFSIIVVVNGEEFLYQSLREG